MKVNQLKAKLNPNRPERERLKELQELKSKEDELKKIQDTIDLKVQKEQTRTSEAEKAVLGGYEVIYPCQD